MHLLSSLSKIKYIDCYYNNFCGFLHKNGINLFGFIMLVVPDAIEFIIFLALCSIKFYRKPFRCSDRFHDFFFSGSAASKLHFSMFAEPDWFIHRGIIHGT